LLFETSSSTKHWSLFDLEGGVLPARDADCLTVELQVSTRWRDDDDSPSPKSAV
jgi:hypothetical protein